jgi:hypothetical protein
MCDTAKGRMKGRLPDRSASLMLLLALATGCSATVTVATPGSGGTGASVGGAGGASAGTSGAGGRGGTTAQTTGGSGGAAGGGAGSGAGTSGAGGAAGSAAGANGPGGMAGATSAGSSGTGGGGGSVGGTGGGVGGSGAGGRGGGGGVAGTAGGGSTGRGGGAGAPGGSGGNGGSAGSSPGGRGGGTSAAGAAGTGEITLDPTPGNYKQTCDGSLGVMIDATHFLDGNDEQQGMRVYTRGANANPVKTIDVSSMIGLATDDEADFEDAARVGDRVYVIESHGRNKDGKLDRARYRFFGMDVGGTSPGITLTVAGYTTKLLDEMLVAANWLTPHATVIATLTAKSNLGTSTDASLAPLAGGTNIEGLAWAPTAARPNQLLIGFRSPSQGTSAIVVSLLNATDVLTGATPQFGEAALLDLGGLGIRAMAWSPLHNAVLLIAGPHDDSASPFRLFKWSGAPADAPVAVQDITGVPSSSAPEAIVTYPNSRDVQILFDEGDHDVGGDACKDASDSAKSFADTIIHVP